MGDISELRGLLVTISFLGILVLLLALIPFQFYVSGEHREVNVPDVFEAIDIYYYAETKSFYMNETGGKEFGNEYIVEIDLGNWDIDFHYALANASRLSCSLLHKRYEWIIIPAFHHLTWYNTQGMKRGQDFPYESGTHLYVEDIEEDGSGGEAHYNAKCSHTQYKVIFAYNSTLYSSFEEAWDYHGLAVFFGVEFDQVNTSYNAWNIVSMLLFFQLPTIHPLINAIIAIPLWICIAYITFILILRAIGAIFGGGA